ncbi:MAG TPA: hypothetical protein VNI78_00515 [Vicinamibacterales bacterium]|nr:hypothetical protein [Vicinamibacterales bacterium]
MSNLFDEVVADVRELPPDEQDLVAQAVLAFMRLKDDAFAPF